MERWSDRDWVTLQLGPLWVVSALLGRNHLDELERRAFEASVAAAPDGNSALPWQLMQGVDRHADELFERLTREDRSIVSGLSEITVLLGKVDDETSRRTREAILRVGAGFARARGPFGVRVSEQDALMLELLTNLLETPTEIADDLHLDVGAPA